MGSTPAQQIGALMGRIRTAYTAHMKGEPEEQESESRIARFCKVETEDCKTAYTSGARDKSGSFVKDCVNVLAYDIAEGKTAEQTAAVPCIIYIPSDSDIKLFSHAQLKTKLCVSLLDANPEETLFYTEISFWGAQLVLTPFYGGDYRALAFSYKKKEITKSISDGEGKSKGTEEATLVLEGG